MLATRSVARWDCRGHFENVTLFPCIKRGNHPTAELFQLKYSDVPVLGVQYANFPLASGDRWNIQKCLMADTETTKSVVSALELAAAVPNSYISTDFPDHLNLKGCSLGLAVFACVMGCRGTFAYTGWVTTYGNDTAVFRVGPVEGTAVKIEHCCRMNIPIFVSRGQLLADRQTNSKCALSRYYRFADYLKGVPYQSFHEAVECGDVAEMLLMAQAIDTQFTLLSTAPVERAAEVHMELAVPTMKRHRVDPRLQEVADDCNRVLQCIAPR